MITNPTFEQALQIGQTGEDVIGCWLRSRGWSILPVYPVIQDTGKGPRLYTAYRSGQGELIATDMLAMNGSRIHWVEAKRKTHFAWYRKHRRWQTGIDLRHYEHYLKVREITQLPVWVMFLHVDSVPSENDLNYGCPPECPTGLFGGEITYLETVESNRDGYQRNGRSYPMVYWQHADLVRLATLQEVTEAVLRVRYAL